MTLLMTSEAPWRAVRNYLSDGGSLRTLAYVVPVFGVIVLALSAIYRLQKRHARRPKRHLPDRLFFEVVRKLGLSVVQRDMLRRIVADLDLDQPAVIFLSPHVFDDCVGKWKLRRMSPGPTGNQQSDVLDNLRVALFGATEQTA